LLDAENALVSNVFARYKNDASEFHGAVALCLLRKVRGKWKLIGLMGYDWDNYIGFL